MSALLVIGGAGAVVDEFVAGGATHVAPATKEDVRAAVTGCTAEAFVIIAMPVTQGTAGGIDTDALARIVEQGVTLPAVAIRSISERGRSARVAVICPACALLPDHLDGARSVVAAGLAMLVEIATTLPGVKINLIAVADNVPAAEVARVVETVLDGDTPSLNGATIRLDGGRDAVLAAETRTAETNELGGGR